MARVLLLVGSADRMEVPAEMTAVVDVREDMPFDPDVARQRRGGHYLPDIIVAQQGFQARQINR